MFYKLDYSKVIGINVFLELSSTRILVGKLERKQDQYFFTYSEKYLNYKKAIPLGHELPLTKQYFEAKELFPFFFDRIPAKENQAYPEYCKQFGISPAEKNAIILLATIGRKGPSWFVFEPIWEDSFSSKDLKTFRQDLGLSTRDLAICFGISQATIVRIENNKASGTEVLKFLDVLNEFPEAAAYYIERYASALHSKTKEKVLSKLKKKLEMRPNAIFSK